MAGRPSASSVAALRARYEQRAERLTTLRHVRSELVSLAGLIGKLPPERAADVLEEMQREELVQLLRESGTADAAELLARMEPDEAVDGLRDLDPGEQQRLLAAMPAAARDQVATLLAYGERTAGGIMTTVLVTATPAETITQVRDRLRASKEHAEDLAGHPRTRG